MKKMIRKMINWANSDSREADAYPIGNSLGSSVKYSNKVQSVGSHSLDSSENPFTFTLYNANGGKVIQCSHYDRVQDRTVCNLYIINQGDNFGDEISMIITKESLSR